MVLAYREPATLLAPSAEISKLVSIIVGAEGRENLLPSAKVRYERKILAGRGVLGSQRCDTQP
jgi:hypothetical protein